MAPVFHRQLVRALVAALVPLFFVLASGSSFAVVVVNLYEAEVPVADHGQKALADASAVALSQVLVKVSGSIEVLLNPAVAAEVARARSYVQQYSYNRDEDAEGDISARFEFDASAISRLVTDAGAPLWTANRPTVLVWIVVQDARGRQFANWDAAPELMEAVQNSFSTRGVPVRFPLFDLRDTASLTVENAWRLQGSPIFTASSRYGVQNILAGRLTKLSTGAWAGDWAYLTANNRVDRSVNADSVERSIDEGVSLVAEQLARRYAVAATAEDAGGILMSVSGVNGYAQYASIVEWLESVEFIQHANVEVISGAEIQLRLTAGADANQLRAIIELNQRLVPVPATSGAGELSFQWQN